MRPRRSPRRGAIEELRRVIDCLPRDTRLAMLDAAREEPIIAGAYTDGRGGMCPMLAAHRRGARTSQLAFARAWDRVVGARRGPQRVGPRERALLGWAGLRGAVPIVLATFVLSSDLGKAETIFNAVFFVVVVSTLVQGTTLEWIAARLGLVDPRPAG